MDEIKIFVSGDFAPQLRVCDYIEKNDIEGLFGDIFPLIKNSDFVITNLEAPLIERGEAIQKTGPNLKAPLKSARFLKNAGFDMVTLANNHLMDYGIDGLHSTISICKEEDLVYIGAGDTIEEASKVVFKVIKGKTIAFINCCESEWSTTFDNTPGCNPLDNISLYYNINDAKSKSDYVIIIVHGGHEMYEYPSPRMKKIYRWFIDIGADAVIGHHTHCYSGRETYKSKPIVYSLGNFVFDRKQCRDSIWNKACVGILHLSDVVDIEVIPFYQCNHEVKLTLLSGNEITIFKKEDNDKTRIIVDQVLLENKYKDFIDSQRLMYSGFLEPFSNIVFRTLRRLGLLKSLLSNRKKKLLLNIIRCESHRDCVLEILKDNKK